MKKILFSFLAVAALASCVKEQTLSTPEAAEIGFASTFVENATKANPTITTESISEFSVWGIIQDATGLVFTDEKVSKVGADWDYQNKQYWVPNNQYYFSAIAGDRADMVIETAAPGGMNTHGLGTLTFTNVAGMNDVLYAEYACKTPASITAQPEDVKFQFAHLLSKVKFSFKNGFTSDNHKIVVEAIKMEVPSKGSIDLTADEYSWNLLEAEPILLDMGHMNAGARVAVGATASSDNELLTIPAVADQEYTVTFTVKLYIGEVCASEVAKTVKISGCVLEPGKAYNFIAEINEQNVGENPLFPITFAANVDEWIEAEYDGGVIPTNAVSTEEELQAAVYEGGLVTLAHDVTLKEPLEVKPLATKSLATKSVASHNVTINLNGHTISGTDENTTGNFGLINVHSGVSLTVDGPGTLTLSAKNDRNWDAYSSVISNQRGYLTVNEGVVIEHLGGTDMAYGIDNLTNGKNTEAVTIVNGATVKSTYRAVRQFLNGIEANNELQVKAGSKIQGANKSIWSQDTNEKANSGKLVVEDGAELSGDVYLYVTPGSTEWPVEASIAVSTLKDGSEVITGNVPAGYAVAVVDGAHTILANTVLVADAEELQAALDAATGYQIVFTTDIAGDVMFAQKKDVEIVVNGNNFKYDGTMKVHSNSSRENNAPVTIKNINFETSAAELTFIQALDFGNAKRYSQNLTVENCTFKSASYNESVVGIKVNATQNFNALNCTAENMHSFIQAQSCDEKVTLDKITVTNCKNGVAFGNTAFPTLSNSKINAKAYGVRCDGNATRGNLVVANTAIAAEKPVIVRKLTTTYNIALQNATLETASLYDVVFTNGDDEGEYVAPTGTYAISGAEAYNVFPVEGAI